MASSPDREFMVESSIKNTNVVSEMTDFVRGMKIEL